MDGYIPSNLVCWLRRVDPQLTIPQPQIDVSSGVPIYRQVYAHFKNLIVSGRLQAGDRLPATRELAGKIGLNRTTITAAYELLEAEGLIRRHVGRGSFVADIARPARRRLDWQALLSQPEWDLPHLPPPANVRISFATSRPSADLFPLQDVRELLDQILDSAAADVLQLGSPTGYPPLRRYLWQAARQAGEARDSDEIIVTSGCQQALDLLQRVLIEPGDTVAVEDPVYPGVHQVLVRGGARLAGVPVGRRGIDLDRLAAVLRSRRPKLLIVTPDFQNPTGVTMPLEERQTLLQLCRDSGTIVAENDIYAGLRYEGAPVPSLKQLDEAGDVIQLRSFSKVAFPGLRVGWVLAPRAVIARLAEAKQWSDLHTDQLAQALLWRFAESGRLDQHRRRVIEGGRRRLAAALESCRRHLPAGAHFTRPEGGMNLWVELPELLDADGLLPAAHAAGVDYLPGRYFAVNRPCHHALRLSFAGTSPAGIREGIAILGKLFREELDRARAFPPPEPAPALV